MFISPFFAVKSRFDTPVFINDSFRFRFHELWKRAQSVKQIITIVDKFRFPRCFLRKFLDGGCGRRDVSIDVLDGSSAASIIGAIYASGVSPTPAPPKRELAFILR